MFKECPSCGSKMFKDAIFCTHCLNITTKEIRGPSGFDPGSCPVCSMVVNKNEGSCPYCRRNISNITTYLDKIPCPSCGEEIMAGDVNCIECKKPFSLYNDNIVIKSFCTPDQIQTISNQIKCSHKQEYPEDFLDYAKRSSTELVVERLREVIKNLAHLNALPPTPQVNKAGELLTVSGMHWCLACYALGVEYYFGNISKPVLPKYLFFLSSAIITIFENIADRTNLPTDPNPPYGTSLLFKLLHLSRHLNATSLFLVEKGVKNATKVTPLYNKQETSPLMACLVDLDI